MALWAKKPRVRSAARAWSGSRRRHPNSRGTFRRRRIRQSHCLRQTHRNLGTREECRPRRPSRPERRGPTRRILRGWRSLALLGGDESGEGAPAALTATDTVIGDGLAWADGDPLGERQTRAANRPTSVAVQVGRAMPPAPLHDPSITEGAG